MSGPVSPRHLFVDERLTGMCVYCGGPPETQDHVPSKILLDEPLPSDLPVVEACKACNESFSKNEEYVACLVECAVSGSAVADEVGREKIRRVLAHSPALAARLRRAQVRDHTGNLTWEAETDRARDLVVKLARGHVGYELSLPQLEEPRHVGFVPFPLMTAQQRQEYDSPPPDGLAYWPEVGSRAFDRAVKGWPLRYDNGWIDLQPGRYRYLVVQSEGLIARMVLSEYLACEVVWD